MPNWCSNSINISGDNEEIKKLLIKAKGEESNFSLENLVPIPEEFKENWYNWRIENWGTKWDLSMVELDINDDSVSFNCETAWAPPNSALQKISGDFPNLSFEIFFEEPGMDFCGKCVFKGGEIIEDISASYSECFSTQITFEMEKSLVDKDGTIIVPINFYKKSDPYDFDEEAVNRFGFLKFKEDLELDDSEASLFNGDLIFVFEKQEDQDAVENALNEDAYGVSQIIEDNLEEIKTTAQYNSLNENLPTNGNNKKRKKL